MDRGIFFTLKFLHFLYQQFYVFYTNFISHQKFYFFYTNFISHQYFCFINPIFLHHKFCVKNGCKKNWCKKNDVRKGTLGITIICKWLIKLQEMPSAISAPVSILSPRIALIYGWHNFCQDEYQIMSTIEFFLFFRTRLFRQLDDQVCG